MLRQWSFLIVHNLLCILCFIVYHNFRDLNSTEQILLVREESAVLKLIKGLLTCGSVVPLQCNWYYLKDRHKCCMNNMA